MPKAHRRRLAAYFTPPHLAHHAINAMVEAGIRPGQHWILDPASGGAAFLVPLAARIAESGHKRGARTKTILQDIERTLHGIEIEPGLAGLSQALLADLLRGEIESSGVDLKGLVQRANTLELERPDTLYDAVIGNPPYGCILRPSAGMLKRYRPVIANGDAIVRSDAVILQRTSNRRQKRRLIAAIVRQADAIGGRGFVTENHTIIIVPDPARRQELPLPMGLPPSEHRGGGRALPAHFRFRERVDDSAARSAASGRRRCAQVLRRPRAQRRRSGCRRLRRVCDPQASSTQVEESP
jgi:hypothetical protein